MRFWAPQFLYHNITVPSEYGYVSTEVHLPLVSHKRTVSPSYKTVGFDWVSHLLCLYECIIPSNEWSLLQILWRLLGRFWSWSWSWSPFLSLLAPVALTCTLFSLRAWRKVNIRKESSIGTCPTSFISLKVSPNCVFIVFFSFFYGHPSCMPGILLYLETMPPCKHDILYIDLEIKG